jgi:hypothetical protein
MKIFGSMEQLAVQVELLEPAGQFVVVHICLWAGGMRIGDYEQAVLLPPIADVFRDTIRRRDRRIGGELIGLTPEEIIGKVKAVLFDEGERNRLLMAKYRELCICPNGSEAFDGEMAVLIEREGAESFIWQDFTGKRIREIRLAPGGYEGVIRVFLAWADPLTGHNPLSEHFAGKTFVIAGKFSRTHSELAGIIRRLGGRVDGGVSERTSYMLAGQLMPQAPESVLRARRLGVTVLSETEFESLLPTDRNA